jgi:transcriptional regulator GlxA family with amidase domain
MPKSNILFTIESINTINRGWGRDSVDTVARHFELGRRQFNRRFTRSIGASPKQMSQVLRAQKAIACLRAGVDVQDVVDRCGFTDQSHLIRDVVNHSNRRPTDPHK